MFITKIFVQEICKQFSVSNEKRANTNCEKNLLNKQITEICLFFFL